MNIESPSRFPLLKHPCMYMTISTPFFMTILANPCNYDLMKIPWQYTSHRAESARVILSCSQIFNKNCESELNLKTLTMLCCCRVTNSLSDEFLAWKFWFDLDSSSRRRMTKSFLGAQIVVSRDSVLPCYSANVPFPFKNL